MLSTHVEYTLPACQPLGVDLYQKVVLILFRESHAQDIRILISTIRQASRVSKPIERNLNPDDRLVSVYATIPRFDDSLPNASVLLVTMILKTVNNRTYSPVPKIVRSCSAQEVVLLANLEGFGDILEEQRGDFHI